MPQIVCPTGLNIVFMEVRIGRGRPGRPHRIPSLRQGPAAVGGTPRAPAESVFSTPPRPTFGVTDNPQFGENVT